MMYFKTRLTYAPERNIGWSVIAEYLQKHIPKDSIILDIGAGYCGFVNNIKAKEKHALDVSDVIEKHKNTDVVGHLGSCTDLHEFKDSYFDVVFASNILEHLSYDEFYKTLTEINRVLRKGGKLMVIQPNFKYCVREYYDDYTHQLVFTHISFCDALVANGFSITMLKPRFLPFTIKSWFSRFIKPSLIRLYLMSPVKPLAKQMLVIAEKTG
jgi:ubiquinone/menaquinone biosynthesis C-methylase UbiE